jgi:hypothetical protein
VSLVATQRLGECGGPITISCRTGQTRQPATSSIDSPTIIPGNLGRWDSTSTGPKTMCNMCCVESGWSWARRSKRYGKFPIKMRDRCRFLTPNRVCRPRFSTKNIRMPSGEQQLRERFWSWNVLLCFRVKRRFWTGQPDWTLLPMFSSLRT